MLRPLSRRLIEFSRYVLNLAIADSLFLALLPLNLVQNFTGKWSLGLYACIAFQGGFYMNYYAGVLFLGVRIQVS